MRDAGGGGDVLDDTWLPESSPMDRQVLSLSHTPTEKKEKGSEIQIKEGPVLT